MLKKTSLPNQNTSGRCPQIVLQEFNKHQQFVAKSLLHL